MLKKFEYFIFGGLQARLVLSDHYDTFTNATFVLYECCLSFFKIERKTIYKHLC